jgi:hypothetical protein
MTRGYKLWDLYARLDRSLDPRFTATPNQQIVLRLRQHALIHTTCGRHRSLRVWRNSVEEVQSLPLDLRTHPLISDECVAVARLSSGLAPVDCVDRWKDDITNRAAVDFRDFEPI